MTQPSTSDPSVQPAVVANSDAEDATASALNKAQQLPQSPAIRHPNFDPAKTPIDPARPLTDIPEPVPSSNRQLRQIYKKAAPVPTKDNAKLAAKLSKWALVESEPFADHLALLSAAQLVVLPASFYNNHSEQPLLPSLASMTLLDMADIQTALQAYPALTRYGMAQGPQGPRGKITALSEHRYDADELLNGDYADDWELLLYPERFDSGEGSLGTDIVSCSVAAHALSQCETRKTINTSYSAATLCQYLRSYLLSQLQIVPLRRQQYRQIRLFPGHVIVAAHYLGWTLQVSDEGECYFNVSSRCSLLARYPNMSDYAINGWST